MHHSKIRPRDSFTLDSFSCFKSFFFFWSQSYIPLSRTQLAPPILGEVQTTSIHAYHTWARLAGIPLPQPGLLEAPMEICRDLECR